MRLLKDTGCLFPYLADILISRIDQHFVRLMKNLPISQFFDLLKSQLRAHLNGGGRSPQVMNDHAKESIANLELVLQTVDLLRGTHTHRVNLIVEDLH